MSDRDWKPGNPTNKSENERTPRDPLTADLDPSQAYMDEVKDAIFRFDPNEEDTFEVESARQAAYYLWWNGYKTKDGHLHVPTDSPDADVYHIYDVLKWTEQNL